MIQFFSDFDNLFFQKDYDEFIKTLNLSSLKCSACELSGYCTNFAHYKRMIVIIDGKESIKILRVQCGQCNTTHALLPSQIVPYSQILLEDHVEIITQYEAGTAQHGITPSNPEIDIWIVVYIIKQYLKHWEARLRSNDISLSSGIRELVLSCFKNHSRQFMQVKRGRNCLIQAPT